MSRARAGAGALRGTVGVFVLPPSFEVLERRLRGRSKDSEEAMQRRLRTAREEVAAFVEYDYVVVNDELERCVERMRSIVRPSGHGCDRCGPEEIVKPSTSENQS